MAFFGKVGNILRQTASKQLSSNLSLSNPSVFQMIRCMSSKVFVGGLSFNTDETSLREAFCKYGEVVDARIITDRESGQSRGFGFITYASPEDASTAIQAFDGQDLHGRRIRVNYATDRAPRSFGGGGGGYGSQAGYGGSGGGYGSQGGYGGSDGNYNTGFGQNGGYGGNQGYGGGGGGGSYNPAPSYGSGNANYNPAPGYGGGAGNYNSSPGYGSGDANYNPAPGGGGGNFSFSGGNSANFNPAPGGDGGANSSRGADLGDGLEDDLLKEDGDAPDGYADRRG